MSAEAVFVLVAQFAVMFACAKAGGNLMRMLGQPAVLGEMIGGILLGPTLFGLVAPDAYAWLFPSGPVKDASGTILKFGLLFFLFSIGLEIDVSALKKHGLSAVMIGSLGTVFPLICGVAIVYIFPDIWGISSESVRWPFAMFIGIALANTANPVLARILLDLGVLKKELGAVLMTASVVDDLVSWSLLAVIVSSFNVAHSDYSIGPSLVYGVGAMVVLATVTIISGVLVIKPFLSWSEKLPSQTGYTLVVTVLLIACILAASFGAERLGIHATFGPFLLGLALSTMSQKAHAAYGVLNQAVLVLIVPIYFASMGLTSNFVVNFNLALVSVVFITACVSKIFAAYAAARLTGLSNQTALAIGVGMNARGAVGIILAGIGLESKVINEPVYISLVVMALATSLMAGPLMKLFLTPTSADLAVNSYRECEAPAEL